MERKLVEQGGSTLMVSLPAKWTGTYGLKKGDIVFLEENGKNIIIKTENAKNVEKIVIDIQGVDNELIYKWITSAYRKGYDEILVKMDKTEHMKIIRNCLMKYFIGLEIVIEKGDTCLAKSFAEMRTNEFDHAMRKLLLFSCNMGESGLKSIENHDSGMLRDARAIEDTINKFTCLCQRMLNKHGYHMPGKTSEMYYIVDRFETLCDEFRKIYDYVIEKGSVKISKETLSIFSGINEILRNFATYFGKFGKNELVMMEKRRTELEKKAIELFKKSSGDDKIILHHLIAILANILNIHSKTLDITL